MPTTRPPRKRHFRTAVTAACIAGALVAACVGRQAPDHHWRGARFEPQDGTNEFRLASPGGWDDLELAVAYEKYHSAHVCGRDDAGRLLIAAAEYADGAYPERTISTFIVSADVADTLVLWPDRWLVCPVSPQRTNSDLLVWFPEAWYERASPRGRADTIGLFQHNYSMDFKLLNKSKFTTSLEAAARGESLAVYSRLAIVGLDGEERTRFGFDPRYTADDGFLYETSGGSVAIVETDGGYANSDLFYLLFSQPRLHDGDAVSLRSSEDIDGSYRGFFLVDLEHDAPLWYRRMGVTCLKNHLVDLDRDGVDEIILDTYCSENGVSGGGTTDAGSVYIICLDQGGNILWKKRLLGVHLGAQSAAVDVTGDGNLEVLVTWSSGIYEHMGGAAVLSADGRTLAERTDLGGLYGMAVADFDGDGEVEIATGGPDNQIYILNASLDVECSRIDSTDLFMPAQDPAGEYAGRRFYDCGVIWRSRTMPIAASDLNGDGVAEVLALHTAWHRWGTPDYGTVLCGRGDIVVLNGQLEELMRASADHRTTENRTFPMDAPASMKMESFPLDIDGDGEPELMVGTKGRGLFAYRGTHGG